MRFGLKHNQFSNGFVRWLAFNLVGLTGVAVQLTTLSVLRGGLGLHVLVATALAVEAAVLNNFFWHLRWTWADRQVEGWQETLSRLCRFNLTVGLISILQNVFLMELLAVWLNTHYLLANIVTITLCSILNYLTSDRIVFRESTPRSAPFNLSGRPGRSLRSL